MLYVREDTPLKQIKLKFIENEVFKGFFVEIDLVRQSGFIAAFLIQIKINFCITYMLLAKLKMIWAKKYDNVILLGDFNIEPEEKNISNFPSTCHLKNIVKQKTCFKNPDRPTYIDLILTNSSRWLQDMLLLHRNRTLRFLKIGCYCP